MELVDTHCHPHFEDYASAPEHVVRDATAAGVTKLIVVGTTLEDSQKALDFAAQHKNAWAAVGVHPHAAREFLKIVDAGLELRAMLKQPKVVATGEIGLDFYRSYSTTKEQESVLRSQIEEGMVTGLPFIFHVRDSQPDGQQVWEIFWQVIDSYPGLRGVIHSFSAHQKQLDQILERGLYVGLNGIMTFTTDKKQLEAAARVPLDKLLLETDAPFLTPKPFRGEVCQPKHVRVIAEFLAELKGESLDKLATETTKNATSLFKLETKDA